MERFRFTTASLTFQDSVEYWADTLLPQMNAVLESTNDPQFICNISGRRRNDFVVSSVDLSAYTGRWCGSAHTVGTQNGLRITYVEQGAALMVGPAQQEYLIKAGDAFLSGPEALKRYEIFGPESGFDRLKARIIAVPAPQFAEVGGSFSPEFVKLIDESKGSKLLKKYISFLSDCSRGDLEILKLRSNFLELLSISQGINLSDISRRDLRNAVEFRLACDLIERNFKIPNYNAKQIAASLGISERRLYQIFEENDIGIHEYIINSRISEAKKD